ncbi:proton-conducting transporter membrane subunit [Geobacter sp. AOG1]|uniref:proton-conducting transporter transmembrane domain-containing protein n=1 Tax=Geobacter sp. AOG1 TaxID=1566346 RepID=UPI001CC475E9|nr:proton-conducting transporter membrane subunit [Geobacter sp. AOG1]GFE56665.1 hydrogenase [Geobacter sp. AOG1]
MLFALVLLPLIGALFAWVVPDNRLRPLTLPVVATIHLVLTALLVGNAPPPSPGGWIWLDPLGKVVLLCISLLFAVCAFYAVGYLAYRQKRSNRILCMGLLVCLSAMGLVTITQHLGLLWVALETTTVSMAPLIYFNQNARSIEATWKYLLICSVGIALALLGLLFLAYSTYVAHRDATLLLGPLMASARELNAGWFHAAAIFLLVGYGSKMGLAPLHTWKPDAYGEAPGLVGALLAGGLVNCAFLSILRVYQICLASGTEIHFFQQTLVGMGLVSMAFAAVFMAHQSDFKRMLAYSSVEHVGILAIGLGLGKGGLYGALFHLLNNGLTKGVLFLSSGNIHRSYSNKTTDVVKGALTRLPWSGGLFLAGFIAITGSPPFSPFISEYTIVSSAFIEGRHLVGWLFLLFLVIVFIGMALTVLPMVMGAPPTDTEPTDYEDRLLTVGPPFFMMAVILVLGIWPPGFLVTLLKDGAVMLGAQP